MRWRGPCSGSRQCRCFCLSFRALRPPLLLLRLIRRVDSCLSRTKTVCKLGSECGSLHPSLRGAAVAYSFPLTALDGHLWENYGR